MKGEKGDRKGSRKKKEGLLFPNVLSVFFLYLSRRDNIFSLSKLSFFGFQLYALFIATQGIVAASEINSGEEFSSHYSKGTNHKNIQLRCFSSIFGR